MNDEPEGLVGRWMVSRVQSFEPCVQHLDQAAFATDQGFQLPSGRPGRTSRFARKIVRNTVQLRKRLPAP